MAVEMTTVVAYLIYAVGDQGAVQALTPRLRTGDKMMVAPVLDRHIEITADIAGGKPRIAGRRITVQNIALWHEFMGLGADEIAAAHELTLGDVYAALAYYFDHRAEIDASIRDDETFVAALRAQQSSPLRTKLG